MTRVAVVQLDASRGPAAAQDEAVAAVERAADGGAELVVLPEYASGWAPRLGPELAVAEDGPFVTSVQAVARRRGVSVVVGVVVPPGGAAADRCANRALTIGPDGALLGAYTKVHLFDAFGTRESDALVAGDPGAPPLVLDVGGLRFGVLTCYDLRFPEVARRLVDAGAHVLVAIAAWASGPGKADQLGVLARARALENTCYLLLASQNGPGRAGHSAVVDPLGVVLAQAWDEDRLLTADLDPAVVEQVRARVPVLEHRRYAVVPRP
jgi:predicted amidohydrolase